MPEHTIFYNKARTAFDKEKNKEARKSWQEKTGSLNMAKDTQKLWNLTKAPNDDQQHAPRAVRLKEGTQIITGKKVAYLLADIFREDSLLETPPIIQPKGHHTDEDLRSLTLKALSVAYPPTTWARAFTYGSAEEAAKNGGGGVCIKFPDGRSIRKSVATGQQSTNYRAEAYALLAAAQSLNQEERLLPTQCS